MNPRRVALPLAFLLAAGLAATAAGDEASTLRRRDPFREVAPALVANPDRGLAGLPWQAITVTGFARGPKGPGALISCQNVTFFVREGDRLANAVTWRVDLKRRELILHEPPAEPEAAPIVRVLREPPVEGSGEATISVRDR